MEVSLFSFRLQYGNRIMAEHSWDELSSAGFISQNSGANHRWTITPRARLEGASLDLRERTRGPPQRGPGLLHSFSIMAIERIAQVRRLLPLGRSGLFFQWHPGGSVRRRGSKHQ